MKKAITTPSAPSAIGPYSQAIEVNKTVYLSGQIALDPITMSLKTDTIEAEVTQVFKNLQSVCLAASGSLDDVVKLTIYLTDFSYFDIVNQTMKTFFNSPFPARATVQVSALPKGARVEVEGIMVRG